MKKSPRVLQGSLQSRFSPHPLQRRGVLQNNILIRMIYIVINLGFFGIVKMLQISCYNENVGVTVQASLHRDVSNSPLRVLKNTEWVSLIDQLSTKTSVLLLAKTEQTQIAINNENRNIFWSSTSPLRIHYQTWQVCRFLLEGVVVDIRIV